MDFKSKIYTGPDCVEWFLRELRELEEYLLTILWDDQRLLMHTADKYYFKKATHCHICKKEFKSENDKVRDHDHITGGFRGAAHASCNLKLRKLYKIPVFFHNFRGYDAHLLVWGLAQERAGKLNVIAQGMERYILLEWGTNYSSRTHFSSSIPL